MQEFRNSIEPFRWEKVTYLSTKDIFFYYDRFLANNPNDAKNRWSGYFLIISPNVYFFYLTLSYNLIKCFLLKWSFIIVTIELYFQILFNESMQNCLSVVCNFGQKWVSQKSVILGAQYKIDFVRNLVAALVERPCIRLEQCC